MAKKANRKSVESRITRFGKAFGEYVPGAAKKLGRVAKRTAIATADVSKKFGEGVAEGWKEA